MSDNSNLVARPAIAERAVALLDILGFRARMETEEPQALFAETIGELPAIIETSSELMHGAELRAAQFSDTIFLWSTVSSMRGTADPVDLSEIRPSEPLDCVEAV
jgi:hypothetical protein